MTAYFTMIFMSVPLLSEEFHPESDTVRFMLGAVWRVGVAGEGEKLGGTRVENYFYKWFS